MWRSGPTGLSGCGSQLLVREVRARKLPAAHPGPACTPLPASAGEASGGTLKTLERADGESLQAGWYSADVSKLKREIPLRAPDILPLIELASAWKACQAVGGAYHHLPLVVPHPLLSLSVLAVSREE